MMAKARPEYNEVAANFEKQTGLRHTQEMFEPDRTTRLISGEYPISAERFVAVGHEAYSFLAFGNEAHVHIHVWKDAKLYQTAFIQVEDLFSAQAGNYERKVRWPEDRYVAAEWSKNGKWVTLLEFDRRDEDPRSNAHGVKLKRSELDLLCERLKPLRGFIKLEGID